MNWKTLLLGFAVCAATQAAQITNGDFGTGDLTGWTVTGNVYPAAQPTTGLVNVLPDSTIWAPDVSASFLLPAPHTGGNYAEISNSPLVNSGPPPQDFSAISTAYYNVQSASASIAFLYNLLTNEFPTAGDYATFTVFGVANNVLFSQTYPVSGINQDGGCVTRSAPDGSTICAASGWLSQSFSLAAFVGSNVRFEFGVYDDVAPNDTQDNGFDTVLLLAQVQGEGLGDPVTGGNAPEPASFVLGGTALVALYLRRRAARS